MLLLEDLQGCFCNIFFSGVFLAFLPGQLWLWIVPEGLRVVLRCCTLCFMNTFVSYQKKKSRDEDVLIWVLLDGD